MALADFQTLWDDAIKPAIPGLIPHATVAEAQSAASELT